ncbi:hypothetical protein SAMN05444714_1024 [Yoonia litorea]|uniref:Uncharacterized protein n=1 Tax=Yoonia litorea TaxID=1123755 RepID=A0A1I6LYN3_9RHOB|nr:hypothetical protein SAMN05444714_1024 [Yoonia litorea]
MTIEKDPDPRGLIREAFRMDGIREAECRSIFLDWALGLPMAVDNHAAIRSLIATYQGTVPADHPMLQVLTAALEGEATPRRRGGRRARLV